jgi:hypothetical protein
MWLLISNFQAYPQSFHANARTAKQSLASRELQMFAVFNMTPVLPAAFGLKCPRSLCAQTKENIVISAVV